MEVRLARKPDSELEMQLQIANWHDAEKIIRFLKRQFHAHVSDKAEGPDARTWQLAINGSQVRVDQWDTGDVSISTKDSSGVTTIAAIADQLQNLTVQEL